MATKQQWLSQTPDDTSCCISVDILVMEKVLLVCGGITVEGRGKVLDGGGGDFYVLRSSFSLSHGRVCVAYSERLYPYFTLCVRVLERGYLHTIMGI